MPTERERIALIRARQDQLYKMFEYRLDRIEAIAHGDMIDKTDVILVKSVLAMVAGEIHVRRQLRAMNEENEGTNDGEADSGASAD